MQLMAQDLRANPDGNELLFTPRWRKEQVDPLLIVKIQLQDKAGIIWQELETELLNEVYFFPRHWQPQETPQVTYRLRLPRAMPPGAYDVKLSLVDQNTGGQLPVYAAEQSGGVIYDAGTLELELPLQAVDPAQFEMAAIADAAWPDGNLRLLGVAELTDTVQAGGDVHLELIWQAEGPLPAGLQIALQLEGADPLLLPLSSFDSGRGNPGSVLRQKYRYPVPGDMGSGDYSISAVPVDSSGEMLDGQPVPLGEVHVTAVDRVFALPDEIALPLDVRFGPGIRLRGVSPEAAAAAPGEPLALTLYWQTEVEMEDPLTAFVHLLDQDGSIVLQADRWPGGIPADLWSEEQVIIDEYQWTLPSDIAPGAYQIATGLYTATDGRRLPVFDSAGERIAGDQLLLPLAVSITE